MEDTMDQTRLHGTAENIGENKNVSDKKYRVNNDHCHKFFYK